GRQPGRHRLLLLRALRRGRQPHVLGDARGAQRGRSQGPRGRSAAVVTRPLRLAVIGDPISHSRSPAIHTAALDALGIEGTYTARGVPIHKVYSVIEVLRAGRLVGVYVTMPFKCVAAALVDEITEEAPRSGSGNTIVRLPDGRLKGYSTDITAVQRV